MSAKIRIINDVIKREGGDKYTDDPSDSGGPTKWGVTERTARANGYHGPMVDLPRDVAFDIYVKQYWDTLKLDFFEARSQSVTEELADTAVNMGVNRTGLFLQRALNALNGFDDYKKLKPDGAIGPVTIAAFNKYMDRRGTTGEVVLVRALNCLQGAFYIELTEQRPKDKKYLYGWLLNRVK